MATQKKVETQQVDLCEIIPILLNDDDTFRNAKDIVDLLHKNGVEYTYEELDAALLKLVRNGTLKFFVLQDIYTVVFFVS